MAASHRESQAQLYAQHAEAVFLWAQRYAGGRRAWAEDLVHDVFVRALEHANELREDDVRGWLYRVTQNLAFQRLRKERLGEVVFGFLRAERGNREAATPESALSGRQQSRSAFAALQRLPGQERVVVGLKVLDGMSQREIAELLSLSEGYVSKLLARAWGRLRALGWEVGNDAA